MLGCSRSRKARRGVKGRKIRDQTRERGRFRGQGHLVQS